MEDENTGFFKVNVTTADGALPIQGAKVTVSSIGENGESRVWGVMTTDSAGVTRTMELPAPPLRESFDGNAGSEQRAYSYYQVDVDAEGYIPERFVNVALFPGIVTIQNSKLIPYPEGYDRSIAGDGIITSDVSGFEAERGG
ncbi:MAG: hypothetical protein IJT91_01890 [Clostridia bacterium]|nr:hypothetical protein [Clostridia bacterium]